MSEDNSTRACGHCGSEIVGRTRRARYCSRICKDRERRVAPFKLSVVSCHGCGITSERRVRPSDANLYCSRECYFRSLSLVSRERKFLAGLARRSARRKAGEHREAARLDRLAAMLELRSRQMSRSCRDCGDQFEQMTHKGRPEEMCTECRAIRKASERRAYKSRRRAVERGANADAIDPIRVFHRDRWICQICGVPTPKRLRGTYEDRAPELDHIVPLSAGGDHTWGNVQCTCRRCNAEKGSMPLGQLGLAFAA